MHIHWQHQQQDAAVARCGSTGDDGDTKSNSKDNNIGAFDSRCDGRR
jgi:hypothetical protein